MQGCPVQRISQDEILKLISPKELRNICILNMTKRCNPLAMDADDDVINAVSAVLVLISLEHASVHCRRSEQLRLEYLNCFRFGASAYSLNYGSRY